MSLLSGASLPVGFMICCLGVSLPVEYPLWKYASDWQHLALDKQHWNSILNDMVEWRATHR